MASYHFIITQFQIPCSWSCLSYWDISSFLAAREHWLSSLVFGIFTWLLRGCKVVAIALGFIFQVRAEERQKELHQQCLSLLSEKQNHCQKLPPWASPYVPWPRTRPYDQPWLPGRPKTLETKLLGLARAHCVYEENLDPVSMEKGKWNENWVDN